MFRNITGTITLPDSLLPAEQREDAILLSFLQWRASGDEERRKQYIEYRDYYEGEHETMLTDRIKAFLDVDEDTDFRMNFTPIPIEVLIERLTVTGFDVKDEMATGDEAEDAEESQEVQELAGDDGLLQEWWTKNGMDLQQAHAHEAGSRDGDAYVIVEWDNEKERPRFSFEMAYDGQSENAGKVGVEVVYDEERPDVVKWAFKKWKVETGAQAGKQRLNIYLPGEIRKYVIDPRSTTQKGWQPLEVEGEEWPLRWVDAAGEPLGVPVFHFRSNGGGFDYGRSDIHDIVPIQRALNKSVVDLLGGADVEAFQLIWATGVRETDDFTIAPRQLIGSSNDAARFGHIPGGDIGQLINLVDHFIVKMAQRSRTPLSYFQVTGQVASAETQKADDTGLVARAEKRAVEYGKAWADVMHMGVKLHNAFGPGGLNEDLRIETIWDSFDRIDKDEQEDRRAERFERLSGIPGVDPIGAARVAGYTEEEIEMLVATRRLPMDEIDDLNPLGDIDEQNNA